MCFLSVKTCEIWNFVHSGRARLNLISINFREISNIANKNGPIPNELFFFSRKWNMIFHHLIWIFFIILLSEPFTFTRTKFRAMKEFPTPRLQWVINRSKFNMKGYDDWTTEEDRSSLFLLSEYWSIRNGGRFMWQSWISLRSWLHSVNERWGAERGKLPTMLYAGRIVGILYLNVKRGWRKRSVCLHVTPDY